MKKLVYLVAPLMVLPCMMSCNKAPTHKVVGVEEIHLDFTTMNDKELKDSSFNEGQDFKFKVKAVQDTGELSGTYTVLPDAIGIYVGDSLMPLTDGYTVEFSKADETEAIVTVKGDKVTSDIYVEGIAKKKDHFIYNVPILYNVKIATNIRSFGYMKKVSTSTDINDSIGFIGADADHAAPQKEDFVIADGEYFHVTGDGGWFDNHVEVTNDDGKSLLTVKGIQVDDALEYILIAAKSNSDDLLESLKWDEIKEIAHNGYAPYLFNIGDTKKVTIEELEYEVRIIDFNHDRNKDGEVAPITFQFTTAISSKNSSGKFVPSIWDSENNNNFPGSSLNTKALPDLFAVFPDELKRNVMEVQKDVGAKTSAWDTAHYSTNLFPLSHVEMSSESSSYDWDVEGSTYEYYKQHTGEANRIFTDKRTQNNKVIYWLRTPTITRNARAWAVDTDGTWRYDSQSVSTTHAVVPAFCI